MFVIKVLILLVFICGASFNVNAQACGYTHLIIYLTDSNGQSIKNAEIKTFDKDFKVEDFLHYPKGNALSDDPERDISWSEEKQTYYGREGMCGGHKDVGLRISAEGFETLDKVINLPLNNVKNPQVLRFTLKRKGENKVAEAIRLARFYGKAYDEAKAAIPSAHIEITDEKRRTYSSKTDVNGKFEFDLPIGNYTIQVSKTGFRALKVVNFHVADAKQIYLDLTLKVRGCDDCNGDILGENNGEKRKEVVLDYQNIKRKNNKE